MSTAGIGNSPLLLEVDARRSGWETGAVRGAMRRPFECGLTAVEIIADWLAAVLAMNGATAWYLHGHPAAPEDGTMRSAIWVSFAVAGLFVLLLDRDGAYRAGNSLLRIKETERALRVSVQASLLTVPVIFFAHSALLRPLFFIALPAVPILQAMEKQLLFVGVRALRARGIGVQRVLIYGAGESGRRVFSALVQSPKLGLNPVAFLDDDASLKGERVFALSYRRQHAVGVATCPVTAEVLLRYRCELLIIAVPSLSPAKFSRAEQAAQVAGARLAFVPGHSTVPTERIEYADIDGILLSVVRQPNSAWLYELEKRTFDLACAMALIVLLAPLWAVIAILVRCDSSGTVLFRHQRVGKDGKLFELYKFRSMYNSAPRYGVSPCNPGDPRITRLGRFLRRTSFDELPQLINVIKGEMSLVGPRPEMEFIVDQYGPEHRQRLEVLPGITGLWQLSADRAFHIHHNLQYDLYYIRHRSFLMDCAILLHTAVFAMRGV